MKINDLSKKSGIPKRTIHFYIQKKLLVPYVNPENGYYEFNQNDLERLNLIKKMRSADLPIAMIRSLLDRPVMSSYYLNLYVRQMDIKLKHTQYIMETMNSILEDLPVHTDYDILRNLFENVNFPSLSDIQPDDYDKYDNSLVNYFLWGAFLPKASFTDYQEYLWKKIDRLTRKDPSPEYKQLCTFLKQMDPQFVEQLYTNRQEYDIVSGCDNENYAALLNKYKKSICTFLENPVLVRLWNGYYRDFFLPNTAIYCSNISDLVREMSDFYVRYLDNIHRICKDLYDWLHSERPDLLETMQKKLGSSYDIDGYNHGMLAATASLAAQNPF